MPGTTVRAAGLAPAVLRGHKLPSGVSLPSQEGGTRANCGATSAVRRARRAWTHVPNRMLASMTVRATGFFDPCRKRRRALACRNHTPADVDPVVRFISSCFSSPRLFPGPVNVLMMSQALSVGWRAAQPCVWGGTCAVLLQLLFTALCLNSLLLIDERALAAVRWAGAICLVYLGCKQWRSGSLATPTADAKQRGLFWRSFATSELNPKTLLFFPSFFPQFISAPSDEAHWSANQQYLFLAATFAWVFALGVASTAISSHRLRTVSQRPKRLRAVNCLMGSLLVGMGALMAAVR